MSKVSIITNLQQCKFGSGFLGCRNDADKAKNLFELLRADPLRSNEQLLGHKFFICCLMAHIENTDQIDAHSKESTLKRVMDRLILFDATLKEAGPNGLIVETECFPNTQKYFREVSALLAPYKFKIDKLITMVVAYVRAMTVVWNTYQKNETNTKIIFQLGEVCNLYALFLTQNKFFESIARNDMVA